MPAKKGTGLLVILDNLEQFAEKLLIQIADESEAGSQRLVDSIQNAKNQYKKPIEAHITGWFYYFSRIRGPKVEEAIESIKVEPSSIKRLETLKSLLQEGQWNVGSFNYCLFIEFINSIPGYEPLDEKSAETVIPRLNVLLSKKIDEYIEQFKANQRLVEEREQSRKAIQAQNALNDVYVKSNLITEGLHPEEQTNKIYFSLSKKEKEWQLFWVMPTGTSFPLAPSEELLRILNDHSVKSVEEINSVLMKQIKKECLAIRDASFAKTKVLINPVHPKTKAELSDHDLSLQGVTSSFVLRGKSGEYTLSWINALGNPAAISLEKIPQLKDWLFPRVRIADADEIVLKAYLSSVDTGHAIGMKEFKQTLQDCLLRRTSAPKTEQAHKTNRLDLGLFKDLELCIGKQAGKIQRPDSSEPSEKPAQQAAPSRKLNLSQYSAVTTLFAHQSEEFTSKRHAPETIVEKHFKCD